MRGKSPIELLVWLVVFLVVVFVTIKIIEAIAATAV